MYHDWKSIILPEYEIRKNGKQKSVFIEMLRGHFGDRLTVEEQGTLLKSRNIVIGNPEQAKVVFTAHYDTCAKMPFPNFITPCNFFVYLVYQLLITVVLLIPPFGLAALTAFLAKDLPESIGILLTELAMFLPLIAEMWLIMAGQANLHTANDNTSGVVTVLTLAERFADRGDIAFILFDLEEMGLVGSGAYAKKHPDVKKNTLIVNLDCVSDGDNLLAVYSKTAADTDFVKYITDHAGEVFAEYGKTPVIVPSKKAFYPSDQAAFTKTVASAALKKAPVIGLYMDRIHTSRDTVFDEKNIAALVKLFGDAAENC